MPFPAGVRRLVQAEQHPRRVLQHHHDDAIFMLFDQDALEANDALVPVAAGIYVAGWQARVVKPADLRHP